MAEICPGLTKGIDNKPVLIPFRLIMTSFPHAISGFNCISADNHMTVMIRNLFMDSLA